MFGEFAESSKLYNQYEHTNSVCGAADETTKYNSFSLEYYVLPLRQAFNVNKAAFEMTSPDAGTIQQNVSFIYKTITSYAFQRRQYLTYQF